MSEEMEVRQFNLREARWETDGKQLSNIRKIVFIVEQNVPQEVEWDGRDEDSWHWLATDATDVPIGTARLLPEGQIGRMAVLAEHRKHGVGAALLEAAVEKARHLGMQDVFLNAQSHALGFYERAGFVAEGDEFMEAGIPHQRMIQVLSPPEDNIQRQSAVDGDIAMAVKTFDTGEADWSHQGAEIKRLRRQVIQTELGVENIAFEQDSDESDIHFVAENDDGHVIGTISMTPAGELSFLVVAESRRGQGIGQTLLELTIQRARRYQLKELTFSAATASAGFLEAHGFELGSDGDFHLTVEAEEPLPERDAIGESLEDDGTYLLGHDKQLILLRGERDFRNVLLEMAGQARQWIRIYSPVLDHALYDSSELMSICSSLARRNKYTKVEILVFDPHRMIKNGHALLNIARKLPSSIGIRVVDPEMRQMNHEYVLVDGQGFIYRQDYEIYEGSACFNDVTQCNRWNRQFTAAWESGILDPNIRQLRI